MPVTNILPSHVWKRREVHGTELRRPQAAGKRADAAEARARELTNEVGRLEDHVHDLETRKRAPLYQKKQVRLQHFFLSLAPLRMPRLGRRALPAEPCRQGPCQRTDLSTLGERYARLRWAHAVRQIQLWLLQVGNRTHVRMVHANGN